MPFPGSALTLSISVRTASVSMPLTTLSNTRVVDMILILYSRKVEPVSDQLTLVTNGSKGRVDALELHGGRQARECAGELVRLRSRKDVLKTVGVEDRLLHSVNL